MQAEDIVSHDSRYNVDGSATFRRLVTIDAIRTGEFSMLCRLFLLFLICCFSALESRGLRSSKLHSNSAETDITAPQLSNSPQYCQDLAIVS
jgi:hypothetical protein